MGAEITSASKPRSASPFDDALNWLYRKNAEVSTHVTTTTAHLPDSPLPVTIEQTATRTISKIQPKDKVGTGRALSYAEVKQDALSWWDDVGFILNRRRVIVWWRHPRHVYRDAIEELAQEQTGEFPFDDWLTRGAIPNYRKVGRSRKKIVSYTCRPPSEASRAYFQRLRALEQEMSAQGIDCSVRPSSKRKRLSWATGLELVAPLEVRNEQELAVVADLARSLLLGRTTLEREFADYCYDKAIWLSEAAARA